jgi:hypothetical protein
VRWARTYCAERRSRCIRKGKALRAYAQSALNPSMAFWSLFPRAGRRPESLLLTGKAADAHDAVRNRWRLEAVSPSNWAAATQIKPRSTRRRTIPAQLNLRPRYRMHGDASQYTNPSHHQGQVFDQINCPNRRWHQPAGRHQPGGGGCRRCRPDESCAVAFENAVNSRHGGTS